MGQYDEVAERVARYHGMSCEDAERVIERLCITDTDDREYLYRFPQNLVSFDVDHYADKTAGASGWVLWFDTTDTAISFTNADPAHHENVSTMRAAVDAAGGILIV